MNCQVPLGDVVVFVKIGCQLNGKARFVVAQMRVVASGWPTKFKVTLPSVFLTMLEISRVTVVSDVTLVLICTMVVPVDKE